jgi:hypothetical protein
MTYLSKADILSHAQLAERDYESVALGGVLRLRELTRAQWRACVEASAGDDEGRVRLELWHPHLFATGVIDPLNGGEPLFSVKEVLAWPKRDELWAEVGAVAQAILELSEVGPEALQKSDPVADER